MVVLGGGAVSYERGTPVVLSLQRNNSSGKKRTSSCGYQPDPLGRESMAQRVDRNEFSGALGRAMFASLTISLRGRKLNR